MAEVTQSTAKSVAAIEAVQERCRELEAKLAESEAALRASEARYQTFVDHTTDGLYLHDSQGRVVDVNRRACESLGYERDELIGMRPTEFDPTISPADLDDILQRLSEGKTLTFDARHRRKDGAEFPVEVRVRPLSIDGQRHALALACDITDRKRAEAELQASEARYRSFVDHAMIGMFMHERDGLIVDVNRQACESLGYEREELIGMTPFDFDTELTPARRDEIVERLDRGEIMGFDSHHRRKDGSVFPVEVRICQFQADGKRQLLALARDITDQKQTEAKLLASEARHRTFVDHVTDALFLQDDKALVIDVNRRACESLGYEREELIGVHPTEFDPDATPELTEGVLARLNAGESVAFESRHQRKDGSIFPVEVRVRPFWINDQRFALALACDISKRKQTEDRLRESEERFRALVDASAQIVWTTDASGRVNEDSPSWRAFTGQTYVQWLGDGWLNAIHPDDRIRTMSQWQKCLAAGTPVDLDNRIWHAASRQWRWTNVRSACLRNPDGSIRSWVGMNIDITERKQAEEELAIRQAELLHASRLTTVGRMVAALSHEVAQPLSAIGNFAAACGQILGSMIHESSETAQRTAARAGDVPCAESTANSNQWKTLREYIQAIATQNQRCGAILERLRDFSQRTATRRSSCDIDPLLYESVALVANELRRNQIEVRFDLAGDLPRVVCDRVQLQQVVVNLLTNARDAVQNQVSERRVVTIRARTEQNSAVFEVEDLGMGVSKDVAARLFEPFFTTKDNGMGIGLSICQSIIKDHHGQIEALSNEFGGATFRVRLPLPGKDDHG